MNRLQSYVRKTILTAARDYANGSRRTADSTRSACLDASRGTDTGWWSDLIYIEDCLKLAYRHRTSIADALNEYQDATGEEYVHRDHGSDIELTAGQILSGLLRQRGAYTFEQYREGSAGYGPEAALLGLRFAVEWYAHEVARDLCPDL